MITTLDFWNDDALNQDTLLISTKTGADLVAPGIVDDLDIDNDIKIDERDAAGQNGATLGFNGQKLMRVTVKLRMWNALHASRIGPFLKALTPSTKGAAPTSNDFVHPLLALWGVSSMLFLGAKGPTKPVKEISYLTIKLIEFAPPPKKSVSSAVVSSLGGHSNILSTPYGPTDNGILAPTSAAVWTPSSFDPSTGLSGPPAASPPSAAGSSP